MEVAESQGVEALQTNARKSSAPSHPRDSPEAVPEYRTVMLRSLWMLTYASVKTVW